MELGNEVPGNVYDIDTDVDEEAGMVKDESKSVEISAVSEPSSNKTIKNESGIKDISKPSQNSKDESPKATSIFDRMSILDPTIPFVS